MMQRPGWPIALAGVLAIVLVAILGRFVVAREGNLAWDDSDYLQRGVRLARLVETSVWKTLPWALDQTLRERPKPPMLIAWVEAVALLVGRRNLQAVILGASVVPYGLLLASVGLVSARLLGKKTVPLALLILAASPMSLGFGAKVMVETFLSIWTLAIFALAAAVVERPDRLRLMGLGVALGLAAITKMTVALFLPVPALVFLVLLHRREGRPSWRRIAATILLPAVLVAGVWYVRNGRAAVLFALHSSRYNLLAESTIATPPRWTRLTDLAQNLTGIPVLLAVVGLVILRIANPRGPKATGSLALFERLAVLGTISGAVVLLVPTHFDPRFLLPVWPALAIGLAGAIARQEGFARLALSGLVVVGLMGSVLRLDREPRTATHWAARRLIDELHATGNVRSIANVGDGPDWNVCKTALINELRDDPADCFVLHDLSRDEPEALKIRLARHDAVFVLDPGAMPEGFLQHAPGFNRGYRQVDSALAASGYRRIEPRTTAGLPPLSVYVRRR